MKMFPSNLKFKKYHKANKNFLSMVEQKVFFPLDGEFAIQANESGKLTYKQIEACRRTLRRGLGKLGQLWIRVFTNVSVTKKPIASRMGKGKGAISYWIAPIKKGQVLFEVNCDSVDKANFILEKASTKLPVKTKVIRLKY